MNETIKTLALLSCVVSLFLITIIGSRVLTPKPCISSTVVKKMIIEGEGRLGSCKRQSLLSLGSISYTSPSYRFLKRIHRMPDPSHFFKNSQYKLSLYIVKSKPFALSMEGSKLIVGHEIARRPGGLERVLIQGLMTLHQPELLKNHFQLEYLTDLYMILTTGRNKISWPSTGESKDYALFSWHQAAPSDCLSPYRSFWTEECTDGVLTKQNLRPFFSAAVGQSLRQLPLSQLSYVSKHFYQLIHLGELTAFKQKITYKNLNQMTKDLVQQTSQAFKVDLDLQKAEWVKFDRYAIHFCGSLKPRKFIKKYGVFSKLLVVPSCQPINPKLRQAYIKDGIRSLSSFPSSMKFVEFHMPSLKLILSKFASQTFDFNQWLKKQEYQWNPSVLAYQLKTDIEAVTYLRVTGLKKIQKKEL